MRGSIRVTWRCPHQKENKLKECRRTDCTGSWYGRAKYDTRETKRGGFGSKKGAEAWAVEQLAEWVNPSGASTPKRITVGHLLDVYIAEQLERTKRRPGEKPELEWSSYEPYELHIRLHIRPLLKDVFVSDLTYQRVKDFHRQLRELNPDMSTTYLQRINATLSIAINYGMRNKLFFDPYNPCKGHQFQKSAFVGKAWSEDDIRRFISLAKDDQFFAIMLVMLLHGVRRGEAVVMHEDVISTDWVWHVYEQINTKRKSNPYPETWPQVKNRLKTETHGIREKHIRIHPLLRPVIADLVQRRRELEANGGPGFYQDPEGRKLLMIYKDGRPFRPDQVSEHFKALCGLLSLEPIRLYDLRHTFITMLHKIGATPEYRRAVAGHSADSVLTDTVYTHVGKLDEQDEMLERFTQRLALETSG